MTAEKTGKSEQLYKDLGTMVFTSLYQHLRRPQSLITKLRGIGSWFLRRERMKIITTLHPPDPNRTFSENDNISKTIHENKLELHALFLERLKEYEEYIRVRDEVRKIRYATQKLLEPPERED